MQILLSTDEYSRAFIQQFLIYLQTMKFRFLPDERKCKVWDTHIKEVFHLQDITTYKILSTALDALEFKEFSNIYIIKVNTNIKIKNNKLIDIVKFIDQGNLEYKGSGLFSNMLQSIKKDIPLCQLLYER